MGSLTLNQEIAMVVLGIIGSMFSVTGSTMIILHLFYRYRRIEKPQRIGNTHSSSNNNNSNSNDNKQATAAAGVTSTILTAPMNEMPPTASSTITTNRITRRSSFRYIHRRRGVRETESNYNSMLGTTDRRILFMMSFLDIIQSTITAIQPFLLDPSNSYFNFGFGTYTTCQVAATIHHMSFSAGMYACMLNYYYLLTVRYGWSQSRIDQSKIEYLMHLIAFGYPFLTAIAGAVMGFWGNRPFFMGCWVGEYPHGCVSSNGTIPCRGPLIAWVIGSAMYIFYVCTLFISNTLLYLHVRKISKKSLYWGFRNRQQNQILLPATSEPPLQNSESRQPSSGILPAPSGVLSSSFFRRLSLPDRLMNRGSRGDASSSIMNRPDSGITSTCTDIEEIHRRRLRRVGMQGVYYVCAGVLVYTPFLITQDILVFFDTETISQSQVYVLLLIQSIVFPLDGLFNAFIYFRPRFLDIRYNQRTGAVQKSVLETLWVCVFGESRRRSRYNHPKTSRLQPFATIVNTVNLDQQQQQQQMGDEVASEIVKTNISESTVKNDSNKSSTNTVLNGSIKTTLDNISEDPDNEQTATIVDGEGIISTDISQPKKCVVVASDSEIANNWNNNNLLNQNGVVDLDDDYIHYDSIDVSEIVFDDIIPCEHVENNVEAKVVIENNWDMTATRVPLPS